MLDLKVNVLSHFSPKQARHAQKMFLYSKSAGVNTLFAKFIQTSIIEKLLFEIGHFVNFSYDLSSISLFMDRFWEDCQLFQL